MHVLGGGVGSAAPGAGGAGAAVLRVTKGNGDDHVAFMRFASSGGFHATGLSQAASLFDMDRTHQNLLRRSGTLQREFNMYNTFDDAVLDTNRWEYCEYSSAEMLGVPSACGSPAALACGGPRLRRQKTSFVLWAKR